MVNYDYFWGNNKIIDHKVWPTWSLISNFFEDGGDFLEIGPGNRPRIPLKESYFVDLSSRAVENLKNKGAKAFVSAMDSLPFKQEKFDVVCAFEILEHVKNDRGALLETKRVLKRDGTFIVSVPLGMKYWSAHDELAGHERRYEVRDLKDLLEETGFEVKRFTANRNITVSKRFFWIGTVGRFLFKKFPKTIISLEHKMVVPAVRFQTKLGAFKGLKWEEGDFVKVEEEKTSAILLCERRV